MRRDWNAFRVDRCLCACAALLLSTGIAGAQTSDFTTLVLEGDMVAGVGAVDRIDNLAINDAGDWLVEVDTDNVDEDTDSALLRNGLLALRESDPVTGPAGATLGAFDSITVDAAGRSGFNFFLDGVADDSGVYAFLDTTSTPLVSTVLVAQEAGPAPDLSAGSTLLGFFDVKINDAAQLLVTASVDDPLIPSTVDRALYLWTTDAATGGILTSTLVAVEGDVLPGQTTPISDFGTDVKETALAEDGDILFAVDVTSGNSAIYLYDDQTSGFTELAQEGDPSPVAGRNWSVLTSTAVGLNDLGQHVYRGRLTGDTATDTLLVREGAKWVQEGDGLAAIGGFTLTGFGSGPVLIDDLGRPLWYGEWNDPDDTRDSGLFLGTDLIVQEGVTVIPGAGTVDTLRGITDGYTVSAGGSVLFEAVLDDGREGAFLYRSPILFADGFESDDTSAWSVAVP